MKGLTVVAVLIAALVSLACSSPASMPSSVKAAPVFRDMDYDINIPFPGIAHVLQSDYPNGIRIAPMEAQRAYDYTAAYLGTPNVYFGETAPQCQYPGVGIVVAPRAVASVAQFGARDWPGLTLDAGVTYVWVGRFVYTAIADPTTYTIDPTQRCNSPRS